MTWEEAVAELRNDPKNYDSVMDNYFEADIFASAERFYSSEEFRAVRALIPSKAKTVLDIGAGRGIATYAFGKCGLHVTALEPDKSNDIGSGAIKAICSRANIPVTVVESFGEQLPFQDASFDIVYARQVLHHAYDLQQFCKEVARVLKPGGILIATREHVLSSKSDLPAFLEAHLLHKLYGGENAFTLSTYLTCMRNAGLTIERIIHPYASVINHAPVSEKQMKDNFKKALGPAGFMIEFPGVYPLFQQLKSRFDNTPGRLYSFVARK